MAHKYSKFKNKNIGCDIEECYREEGGKTDA